MILFHQVLLDCVPPRILDSGQEPFRQDVPSVVLTCQDLFADAVFLWLHTSLHKCIKKTGKKLVIVIACKGVYRCCGSRSNQSWASSESKREQELYLPWFWICREANVGFSGPSGELPFKQKLISVNTGRGTSANVHPILTPPNVLYFGHSSVCPSSLCLQNKQIR